jgi:polyisoprenoid-binding protein YceI
MAQARQEIAGIELPHPGVWTFDPNHTKFGFTARHLMVTKVRGHFAEFDGDIHIGERPEDSSVNVVVKTASVDTGSPDRDKHLRSEDFFDVDRYPKMTFRSTKVERAGDAGLRITGELTIRDVTRPITFEGQFEGMVTTPWGATTAGFSAAAEIDREDWGLTWNVALESGGWLVSKKVEISLDVEIAPAPAEDGSQGS